MFRIHGPFLFGATDKIRSHRRSSRGTGADRDPAAAQHDRDRRDRTARARRSRGSHSPSGRELILCGAPRQPAALMEQAEFHDHVGARNICPNIKTALERAAELHGLFLAEAGRSDQRSGSESAIQIQRLESSPFLHGLRDAEIGTHRMPDVMLGSYADLFCPYVDCVRDLRASRRRGLRTDDDRHDFRARRRQPGARAPGRHHNRELAESAGRPHGRDVRQWRLHLLRAAVGHLHDHLRAERIPESAAHGRRRADAGRAARRDARGRDAERNRQRRRRRPPTC